ncbi:MAG: hypothetical protein KDC98_14180 [Planctomycetes bacterium]|nr:hypothetical protein [Planctomycetota bacterium]
MEKCEHVIVLMLENRSFDHMLGFLEHEGPDSFPGLTGTESNPLGGANVTVTPSASEIMAVGPGHAHADIMYQLTRRSGVVRGPYNPTNDGFADNYREVYRNAAGEDGHGAEVMRCLTGERAPVLHHLAREYAVCTRWFSSVPGMTQPNRHFVHAATSDGLVDNKLRPLTRDTIYQRLQSAGRSWRLYLGGASTIMQFPWLNSGFRRRHRRSLGRLLKDIRRGDLPDYSFVDPDHFFWFSNSQHPSRNDKDGEDFRAGEKLIADIYNALVANPSLFEKTVFVVTYDEHGGFFDRCPPPEGASVHPPDDKTAKFAFDLLGARVPTVIVSPWIDRGRVDDTVYDHASVPATVRAAFCSSENPLTERDRHANSFLHLLTRTEPRRDCRPASPRPVKGARRPTCEFSEFQEHLIGTAIEVHRAMLNEAAGANMETYNRVRWWGEGHAALRHEIADRHELEKFVRHVSAAYVDG